MAQLYTEHLSMREIRYEDYEEFFKKDYQHFKDEYKFFTKLNIKEVLKFVEHHVKVQSSKDRNEYVLLAEYDDKVIGGAALWLHDENKGEIGFCLKNAYINSEFELEIVEALLKFGFNHFGLEEIETPFHQEKEEDKEYIQKFSMIQESHGFSVKKEDFFANHNLEPIRNIRGQTEDDFLKSYNPDLYKKAAITADVCVMTVNHKNKLEFLLVKRGDHPYLGSWALPGGFFDPLRDDHIMACGERELKEETHLARVPLYELKTWSRKGRDPRDRIVTTSFVGFLPYEEKREREIYGDDDAADADFFQISFQEKDELVEVQVSNLLESGKQVFKRAEKWEEFSIHTQGEIASDHGILIYHAILSVRERFWLDARGFELLPNPFEEEAALDLLEQFGYGKRDAKGILKHLLKRGVLRETEKGYVLERIV